MKRLAKLVLTPEQVILAKRKRLRNVANVRSFLTRLVLLGTILYVLFGRVFGVASVKTNDMTPRFSAGDLVLYYRLQDEWRADDVAVFTENGRQYLGRVIAVPGDSVIVTDDAGLMINGSMVIENNIYYSTPPYESGIVYPVVLGEGEVFILCDMREGGKDSRYFGPVRLEDVEGKVITVVRRTGL